MAFQNSGNQARIIFFKKMLVYLIFPPSSACLLVSVGQLANTVELTCLHQSSLWDMLVFSGVALS
jgi:hypothetical protein